MEATPVAHNAGEYRGFALAQLRILSDYCKRYKLNIASRKVELANGVIVVCQVCYNKEDVWITLPPVSTVTLEVATEETIHGFLAHPRNGTVRGFQFPGHDAARTPTYGIAHTGKGYKLETINDVETIVDLGDDEGAQVGIPYPLADDRATVYHFELVAGEWTAEGPQELMYGNVDWKGPKTDDPKDRKILTYKGNPSRYWPVDNFCEIPGLSSVDHSVEGLLNSYEYMTVFGDKVYQNGDVLVEMPWLYHPLNATLGGWEENHQNAHVLGAAIRQLDELLICVVKTCYNSYPILKPVPTGVSPDPGYVSAWHTYKDGVVYKDWLADKAGAEKQVADSQGALTLVEVPDPGRGYFVELIVNKAGNTPGGWTRLLRIATPSWCNVNWFFSEDGTKACSVMFGELHKIEISGDVATHTTESLGGFKNEITFTSRLDQESNPGIPDPAISGGIFSNVYRVGVSVGDWINKDDVTQKYTSSKSGKTTLAADYKGNELVKMEANLSGSETYDYFRRYGKQWGKIASMPYIADRWAPDKRIPSISIATVNPGWSSAGIAGVICVTIAGACKPVITLSGVSASPIAGNPLCFNVSTSVPCSSGPNSIAKITVTATVTDEVTGLSATTSRTYLDPRGHWVETYRGNGSYVGNGGGNYIAGSAVVCETNTLPTCSTSLCYGAASFVDSGLIWHYEQEADGIVYALQTIDSTGGGCPAGDSGMIGTDALRVQGTKATNSYICTWPNGSVLCHYQYHWVYFILREWRC